MIDTNILKKIKPKKILGKGSEGTVILSNNKKYTVKIYEKNIDQLQSYIEIINYLQNIKKIPKTIYKSYLVTTCKNSLNRYMIEDLPNHFSYINNNNLKILLKKYDMKDKLFEIMKTYDTTLKKILKTLNLLNINLKNNILNSLYKQGILTLLWLYINKGIVHNDIILDNFFVLKTTSKNFKIKIYDDNYKIDLYGYYLIIADFGYARSTLLNKNIKDKMSLNNIYYQLNPLNDIKRFINIFINKIYIKNINTINDQLNRAYNIMIDSYIKNTQLFNKYKNTYNKLLYKYIKYNILMITK
jgi:hypothetical protein